VNKQDILKALRAGYSVYLNGQRTALIQPDGNSTSVTYKSAWAAVCAIPREERDWGRGGTCIIKIKPAPVIDESDDATERALQITQERDQ